MRKVCLAALLFILTCLPLFSQFYREAKIFVPPIVGLGTPKDHEFFQKRVSYEVILQYHDTVSAKRDSQFTLRGLIQPYDENVIETLSDAAVRVDLSTVRVNPMPKRPFPRIKNNKNRHEFFSWETGNSVSFYDTGVDDQGNPNKIDYIFYMELLNSETNEVIGEQYMVFNEIDESVNQMLSMMVGNMLSVIPDYPARKGDFRDKWVFLDVSALWAPLYFNSLHFDAFVEPSINWLNFGARFSAELHFINFMSLGLGLQFIQELIVVEKDVEEYSDVIMQIPLTLKFVFKPGKKLMLEPYAGVSANFSVNETTEPSLFSWLGGFQIGTGLGPGLLVIDPRVTRGFYPSNANTSLEHQRFVVQLGIGYKIGIIER